MLPREHALNQTVRVIWNGYHSQIITWEKIQAQFNPHHEQQTHAHKQNGNRRTQSAPFTVFKAKERGHLLFYLLFTQWSETGLVSLEENLLYSCKLGTFK